MSFKIDAMLPPGIEAAAEAAKEQLKFGYDGLYVSETQSDPFLDCACVARDISGTDTLLGTNLAIAFARSPFVTAMNAWQLQKATRGNFALGLGTQVKGHIERRFSMTWDSPGPRLREYLQALKAMWSAFAGDAPFHFEGKYYTHTVINPFFDPGPIGFPSPPVWLAAVNPYNARTAGLVGDGLLVHPVHSIKYLDEVLLPALDEGLAASGRRRTDVSIVIPVFLVVGDSDDEAAPGRDFVKSQLSFYGSTRTYANVFECHGWSDIPPQLHALMRAGDFAGMADLITDEMLEVFAITGKPSEFADAVRKRYEGIADRMFFYNVFASPFATDEDALKSAITSLQG